MISLAGEVDLYTAPEFKQQLLEVIRRGCRAHVIVDFSDTTFIDSTTLGVLVGGVKRLRTNDGQLRSSAAIATSPRSSRSPGSTVSSRSTRRATRRSAGTATARCQRSGDQLRRCTGFAAVRPVVLQRPSPRSQSLSAGCGAGGVETNRGNASSTAGRDLFLAKLRRLPYARGGQGAGKPSARTSTTPSPTTARSTSGRRRS